MNSANTEHQSLSSNRWHQLKQHTSARVGLDRAGISITTNDLLAFRLDHARARDAVYSSLAKEELARAIESMGPDVIQLRTKATTREMYLQRPDHGRQLEDESLSRLSSSKKGYDIALCIADGLSAEAINMHAVPVIRLLLQKIADRKFSTAPVTLVEQGRVAVADEIGESLKARLSVILIGERPGLTSPTSMGAYLTYQPKKGTTDESRNCISNIRPEGLDYEAAASKLAYFIDECFARQLSGVAVKDKENLLS